MFASRPDLGRALKEAGLLPTDFGNKGAGASEVGLLAPELGDKAPVSL